MAKDARPSFEVQRQHVVQLSRDRKNGYGGYAQGLRDLAEMGPPQGEHWPLSAEQIRLAFGVPEDTEDPDSSYVLLLRAESHAALEKEARGLRVHAPGLHAAWSSTFDADEGGDRDHENANQRAERIERRVERLVAQARGLRRDARAHHQLARVLTTKLASLRSEAREPGEAKTGEEAPSRDELQKRGRERRRQLDLWLRKMRHAAELLEEADTVRALAWGPRSQALKTDLFLNLLTLELRDHELIVEFARRQTRMEEQAMDEANQRIWDEYQDLLAGSMPKKTAKEIVCNRWGIHERTLARIEERKREEMGLEPRGRGRPPNTKEA